MGLMSPGGVHSHEAHAVALAKLLHAAGCRRCCTPSPMGGTRRRNPPRTTSRASSRRCQRVCELAPCAALLRHGSRQAWDRVAKAYNVLVDADGANFTDPVKAVRDAYAHNVFDEFIAPAAIGDYQGMRDGDGVLCFNFRSDRVREILGALLEPGFDGFPRARVPRFVAAVGMTRYSDELAPFLDVMFRPIRWCMCWALSPRQPDAPSFAWRRPRSSRTSPTS